MKKSLFILAGLFFLSLSLISQSNVNLVIFSEDGDPFFAFINGVKQNSQAETNVKFTNLASNISLRIEFENKALPQLKQAMALEAGFEHTARIKRDMKKQLKLRYFGSVPITDATQGLPTIEYHTAEESPVNSEAFSSSTNPVSNNSTGTIINSTNTNSGNVSININVPGVNMNVNGIDPNVNTVTSTTVSSSSSSSGSYNGNETYTSPQSNHHPHDQGCRAAMNQASFLKMKESIESKSFSDTKMSTAKVATKNACLSVNQIKTIASLFSMDDDKLAYAKYAYDHCVDKANYYQVSDVFHSSFTTDELNTFLQQ